MQGGLDIRVDDIAQSLRSDTHGFGASLPGDRVVLSGGRQGRATASGIRVNLHDARAEADFETCVTRPANLILHMVLDGEIEGRIGPEAVTFARRPGAPVQIHLSALAQPMEFRRRARRGASLRKVTIVVPWAWLAARGVPPETILRGAPHRADRWLANPADISRAEALLAGHASAPTGPIDGFATEALALSILHHAMEHLVVQDAGLSPQDRQRLSRMEAAALADGPLPPVETLAELGGMSVSSMRRLFRRAYDLPVHSRLRQLRLERAAKALQEGATVAEAAHRAGYETPAAFATAFRLAMGVSPSRYRTSTRPTA